MATFPVVERPVNIFSASASDASPSYSYTVPANRYAKISLFTDIGSGTVQINNMTISNQGVGTPYEFVKFENFVLNAGDTLTLNRTFNPQPYHITVQEFLK